MYLALGRSDDEKVALCIEELVCIEELNFVMAEKAYQLFLQALEQSKGIQKYTIYKSIERYFPQFIEQHKQVV